MDNANGYNSFLLFTSYYRQVKKLTIEQRGILLTALFAFQLDEELPEMDDLTEMCFMFVSADIERNKEKYKEIIQKRSYAGKRSAEVKRQRAEQENSSTNATPVKSVPTRKSGVEHNVDVYVDDDEYVNVDENVYVYDDVQKSTPTNTHTDTQKIPTVTQLKAYCLANAIVTDVEKFYQYNSAKNWPMRWQDALALWVKKDQEQTSPKRKFNSFNDNIEKHGYTQEYFDNIARVNADRLEKIAHDYMERSQQA